MPSKKLRTTDLIYADKVGGCGKRLTYHSVRNHLVNQHREEAPWVLGDDNYGKYCDAHPLAAAGPGSASASMMQEANPVLLPSELSPALQQFLQGQAQAIAHLKRSIAALDANVVQTLAILKKMEAATATANQDLEEEASS
ncbi:hypothetical protein PINS_up017504 [Pythium insidiosum]|nr:hypothetical protein PINS_up017504 [Pythium insidiosum]